MVVRTVLAKAQEELNDALRFRKKQFNDPNLYLWVEIDIAENEPFVCLKNENAENLIRLTAEQLLQDKDIQHQLKKIPSIVRSFINFKKIVPIMNERLILELGTEKFLKISEGNSTAILEIYKEGIVVRKNVDLYQIFG